MNVHQVDSVRFVDLVVDIVREYQGDAHVLEKLIGAVMVSRAILRMPPSVRHRWMRQIQKNQELPV